MKFFTTYSEWVTGLFDNVFFIEFYDVAQNYMILGCCWKCYFTHKVKIIIFLIFCSCKYAMVIYRWIYALEFDFVTDLIFDLDLYSVIKELYRFIFLVFRDIQWSRQEYIIIFCVVYCFMNIG